ncbi:MAG TPA: putative toxin-antitoxin system toxin component, PIN family [Puia sp.]|nr:putative toxin-antitoxin system toxin component, PIN family [Puia sp.]
MTKVFVFDTNSLISAHLLPSSTARKAFDLALVNGILVHSKETFAEFLEVFTRPKFDKYISLDDRLAAVSQMELISQLIDVSIPVVACRDPKDDKFLALALAIEADCIVTGDEDLLVLNPFRNIPILSPGNFLTAFKGA